MITIAGEGIELAVATDHNHISDYTQYQKAAGTQTHFHSISGDEVTTHNGHFTAFPFDPAKAVPVEWSQWRIARNQIAKHCHEQRRRKELRRRLRKRKQALEY
ncbi:MAG: hypothetical protein KDA77_12775 [Planctomycetaceae bacterium]|nr:hypothetical protein [Planctomycetaceae bacterium]